MTMFTEREERMLRMRY